MSERFTVTPHFFWRQLFPWPRMWCRAEYPGSSFGGGCRFRHGHPFPHEDFAGNSWEGPR